MHNMITTTTTPPTADNRPYEPRGAARDLFYCKADEVLIEGPAGTGKTRAVLEKMHLCAEKYAGCRILAVRKTRVAMTESILLTWERDVLPPGHPILSGPSKAVRQSYVYPNGSTIVIGGLDKPEKIMSTEYDMVCGFEATELFENDWEMLLTRLRNPVMPYHQGICDCNPGAPSHWLNQRANAYHMERLLSRHKDNPTVTPEYLAKLDQLSGVRHGRLRLGNWVAAEGQVYEEWDAAVHLVDSFPVPGDWRRFRVVDFGYTNPFVCQWWAVDGDGRIYLYREIYRTGRVVKDHAKQIKALSEGESIDATVCDHDREGMEQLRQTEIPAIRAVKAVETGIEAVRTMLRPAGDGKPRLYVMKDALVERDPALVEAHRPTCTAEEWENYSYPKTVDNRPIKEAPVKIDDHGMDAVRYGVMYVDPHNQPSFRIVGDHEDETQGEREARHASFDEAFQKQQDEKWQAFVRGDDIDDDDY